MTGELEERIQTLRDRADQGAPDSWVPDQPGDEIAGVLVRYERGTTSYGNQIIAVLKASDGGERSVWLLHAVLRGEFAKLRPEPGELVLVRYEGKHRSEAGSDYVSYRVEVEREEPPAGIDWSEVEREASGDPSGAAPESASRETDGADPADDIPF